MLIPALIFVVVSSAGAIAGSRILPDLAAGSVGGLAFFTVCGLLGAAAGLLSVHIYSIVEGLEHSSGQFQREIVANGIVEIAFEVGSLLALTSIVYLLAPAPELEEDLDDQPAA
jgi:hypothetical protein